VIVNLVLPDFTTTVAELWIDAEHHDDSHAMDTNGS
jgi:hypothetical protein